MRAFLVNKIMFKKCMSDYEMTLQFLNNRHAVVGETFAMEISYETKNLIYMFLNSNLGICAWKCS